MAKTAACRIVGQVYFERRLLHIQDQEILRKACEVIDNAARRENNRQAVARDLFLKTVAGFGLTTLNAYCTPAMVVETAGIYTKIYCYELSLFGKYKVDMDLLDIVLMLAHLQALQYSIFNDNVDVDALEDMLDKFFDNIVWGKCVE